MRAPRLVQLAGLPAAIVDLLEAGEDAGLRRLLEPLRHHAELPALVPAIARAFPRAAGPSGPAVSHWPAGLPGRLKAVLAGEIAQPFDLAEGLASDRLLLGWNWLACLPECLEDTEAAGRWRSALRQALGEGGIEGALALLDQSSPAQGERPLVTTLAVLARQEPGPGEREVHLMRLLVGAAERQPDSGHLALALAIAVGRAGTGIGREDLVQASHLLAASSSPVARELATAAALTHAVALDLLRPDLLDRARLDTENATLAIARPSGSPDWPGALDRLLTACLGQPPAHLLGAPILPPGPLAPHHGATADRLAALAGHLAARAEPRPILAAAAALTLLRLRRRGLAPSGVPEPGAGERRLLEAALGRRLVSLLDQTAGGTAGGAAARAAGPGPPAYAPVAPPAGKLEPPTGEAISICILSHNQSLSTLRLLVSLHRVWPEFAGEVLVLDNGSAEADRRRLQEGAGRLGLAGLQILGCPANLGSGPGRNALFAAASRPWVLSLDNDMVLLRSPETAFLPLARQSGARFLNIAYEELEHPGSVGLGKSWQLDRQGGQVLFRTRFLARRPALPEPAQPGLVQANRLSGGACLLHRATFQDLGGFEPDNPHAYEDYELSLRLAAAGHPVLTPDVTLLLHAHTAARHAGELAALDGRLGAGQAAAAQKHFDRVLTERLGARLPAAEREQPHAILPARLDLRHAGQPAFHAPASAGGLEVAILAAEPGELLARVKAAWPAGLAWNATIMALDEVDCLERALLLLQAHPLIVADTGGLALDAGLCRSWGLCWEADDQRPPAIVSSLTGAAAERADPGPHQAYPGGPIIAPVRSEAELQDRLSRLAWHLAAADGIPTRLATSQTR